MKFIIRYKKTKTSKYEQIVAQATLPYDEDIATDIISSILSKEVGDYYTMHYKEDEGLLSSKE